jgi:hypothetical protein
MPLPRGSHCVRICPKNSLQDGEISADCFVPHEGTDTRPIDRYLSVHWLEYLGAREFSVALQRLRDYLQNSPFSPEFKPTAQGKMAVLPCDQVVSAAAEEDLQLAIEINHVPRLNPGCATGIETGEDGVVRDGVAYEQVAQDPTLLLDPHSGIFTLPEEAAFAFAVQAFLAQQVIYSEPGKLQ